ncbi:LOW QUALITY PROTEIN: hypothetical protein V2J09_004897 [Rumex salicifolius]
MEIRPHVCSIDFRSASCRRFTPRLYVHSGRTPSEKLVVGDDVTVKEHIFKWLHDSALGGHSGRDAIAQRIKSLFYWPRMNVEIQNYVRNCTVCQTNKYDQAAKPGLIQPLPVPEGVWQSISLDFIEGLPPSFHKHCILVVVDRLSKYAHFLALSHPYTALDIAQAYMDNPPPLHLPYLPGESSSAVVDRSLQKREELIAVLKFHLLCAQNRMRQYSDARRSDREFKIGDYVYLKLQPYKQHSLKTRIPHKLSPRYYGPFKVVDRVGVVAYKLELPTSAAIHDVFHVSQLKLCPNPPSSTPALPQYLLDMGTPKEPEAILERKMVKRRNAAVTKVLVHWKGFDESQATWEFYQDFIAKYPHFHP